MTQELENEEEVEVERDPLLLLSYTWSVEAFDEEDALFKAMERSSLIPEYIWRNLVVIESTVPGIYIIYNKKGGSSVMARVVPTPERSDPISLITGRYTASSLYRNYYVTFYPRTYRVRGNNNTQPIKVCSS